MQEYNILNILNFTHYFIILYFFYILFYMYHLASYTQARLIKIKIDVNVFFIF